MGRYSTDGSEGAALCNECEEPHPLVRSTGLVAEHYLPGAIKCDGSGKPPQLVPRLPDVVCIECRQEIRSTDNGTIRPHNARGQNGMLGLCEGSGTKVLPPSSTSERPDDRTESSSIRTVSGGLGSMGKR